MNLRRRGGASSLLISSTRDKSILGKTLEEVAIGLDETFKHSGGVNFSAVPCLNDSSLSIGMLDTLVRQELQGWAD